MKFFLYSIFFIFLLCLWLIWFVQKDRVVVDVELSSAQKSILLGARKQIGVVISYDRSNGYFSGGYPPDNTGVCSDVIWRALKAIGMNVRADIDGDIRVQMKLYGIEKPDSNIDFRRVKNLRTFFDRTADKKTLSVLPGNIENLKEWRGGDIVAYDRKPGRLEHIAIVSDKRNRQGIPYIIDNHGNGTEEVLLLTQWKTPIIGHWRIR